MYHMWREMLTQGVTSVFVMLAHPPTFLFFGKAYEVQLKLANKTEPISKGDRTGKMRVAC